MTDQRLSDLDFRKLCGKKSFHPSPRAWEDQVFYFLMLDRFSDGNEQGYRDNNGKIVKKGRTPLFRPGDENCALLTPESDRKWNEAGAEWAGGTLKGLESKIGYLKRLGVTAIWVSPVFRQVAFQKPPFATTYHGYGIQNYLDVDRHFGTGDDLRKMVATAHAHGIYVILDIILNHAGNVFAYEPDRHWTAGRDGKRFLDPRWDGRPYRVKGFRDRDGNPTLPFAPVDLSALPDAWPGGAVWPVEMQDPSVFTQRGRISSWDYDPEFLEGDFFDLKDIALGRGPADEYLSSRALRDLSRIYRFWIAFADVDGFRIDTVKHMDKGATRFFASAIHEFAQSIGKDNFYLIAEITGGRERAYDTLDETGVDAALGIDDIPDKLEWMMKGFCDPSAYFDLFRNSIQVRKDSHVWFRNKVVTVCDDHDQVRKGEWKARFCADDAGKKQALALLAINATTLGIPCIYYGSEQRFDGSGGNDRYIREAMFGGEFGAFRSRNRHVFDEDGTVYRELAKILGIRRREVALRRGRQYLRPISGDGENFGLPRAIGGRIRSVVAWSRICDDEDILLAVNTDPDAPRTAWVTIDDGLHDGSTPLTCLYSTDPAQAGSKLPVERRNGRSVRLAVPAAGFVICK